jgi:ATP-binding cassette subfamily G (WHITE) protein 2
MCAAPGSQDAANGILPTYATTLLFFGGLLITKEAMPAWLRWYSYIDFVRYGWGALMVNQWGANTPLWAGDQTVLQFYGFEGVSLWAYVG